MKFGEKFEKPSNENIEPVSDDKESEENKEKTTEDKIGKVDEIFDELLDKVKDAPEAQQEALKILIQQMRQIGEQMKQIRDMKNLHEIKKLMMKHWDELNKLAKGDPQLLKSIQDWGKKFVESKVIYYELIEEVKDELIDKSQELQEAHDYLMIDLGEVCGLLGPGGNAIMMLYINQSKESLVFKTGLEKFIKNLAELETGHDSSDLLLEEANKFLENLNGVILMLSQEMTKKTFNDPLGNKDERYADKYPQIKEILERIKSKKGIVSRHIKDASKIFKVIKKIRDTHFLPLFNEQPEQIAA